MTHPVYEFRINFNRMIFFNEILDIIVVGASVISSEFFKTYLNSSQLKSLFSYFFGFFFCFVCFVLQSDISFCLCVIIRPIVRLWCLQVYKRIKTQTVRKRKDKIWMVVCWSCRPTFASWYVGQNRSLWCRCWQKLELFIQKLILTNWRHQK